MNQSRQDFRSRPTLQVVSTSAATAGVETGESEMGMPNVQRGAAAPPIRPAVGPYQLTTIDPSVDGPSVDGLGKPPKEVPAKDFLFPDGYGYRQFANGDLLIIASPKRGAKLPIWVKRATSPDAWRSITGAIQAQKAGKSAATIAAFAAIAAIAAAAIVASTVRVAPRHGRDRDDIPVEAAPLPPAPPVFPWVPVGIGAAVLVGLLALRSGS